MTNSHHTRKHKRKLSVLYGQSRYLEYLTDRDVYNIAFSVGSTCFVIFDILSVNILNCLDFGFSAQHTFFTRTEHFLVTVIRPSWKLQNKFQRIFSSLCERFLHVVCLNCADGPGTVGSVMTENGGLEWSSTRQLAMTLVRWIAHRELSFRSYHTPYSSDARCRFNSKVRLSHILL